MCLSAKAAGHHVPVVGRRKYPMLLCCPRGYRGVGVLSIRLSNGKEAKVAFQAHFVKLLVALLRTRQEDAGLAGARGWRSRPQIASLIAGANGCPVEKETISSYAVNLLQAFAAAIAVASPGESIPLIERKRNIGYRLAEEVQIEIIVAGDERAECA